MAQKNRSKEIWLVPKRINLHQTICLIDGIIEKNYDASAWNVAKQGALGVCLKKWGATMSGKNISPQAIRTLVAFPQYLGFLYINTNTTPNTLCLTDAGRLLWETHKSQLEVIPNLKDGKDSTVVESDIVLHQMEKLQITNPIILKDCENILVFPFRLMLKILRKVKYLDQEEIAYFLFKARNEDEEVLLSNEIENFRGLSKQKRSELIDAFKNTHIGNITLVQAPSAGYYISLCQSTGIIEKIKKNPENLGRSITAIQIKEEFKAYVDNILDNKYVGVNPYDYSDNLELWIDYIGNPNRETPPIDIMISNETSNDYFIQFKKDSIVKYDDVIPKGKIVFYPAFVEEQYEIDVIDVDDGNIVGNYHIVPHMDDTEFAITEGAQKKELVKESFEVFAELIKEHSSAKYFSESTMNYLQILTKIAGVDKTKDSSLRGAYYEYYFYKLLTTLQRDKVIDNVIWNGKLGKYNLPVQAPGGRIGTPDIVFTIDDLSVVLELTTIKSKSLQFSAEGASVPDHVRLYRDSIASNVSGIFCAPIIDIRTENAMKSTLAGYGINLKCVTDLDLIKLLSTKNREEIKRQLQ